jgi:hypothetical protein
MAAMKIVVTKITFLFQGNPQPDYLANGVVIGESYRIYAMQKVNKTAALKLPVKFKCLIHNPHSGKILSFYKTFDLKLTHLKEIFDVNFHLASTTLCLA